MNIHSAVSQSKEPYAEPGTSLCLVTEINLNVVFCFELSLDLSNKLIRAYAFDKRVLDCHP